MSIELVLAIVGGFVLVSTACTALILAVRHVQERYYHIQTPQGEVSMSAVLRTLFGSRKRKVATATAVVAMAACGTALAAWLISSTGPGAGAIGSLTAPTIQAGSIDGSACLPGGTCSAYLDVNNPNSTDLTLTGLSAGTGTGTTSKGTSCPISNISISSSVASGLSIDVPSGDKQVVVPAVFMLSPSAPTACQGATFTTPVTASFQAGS